MQNNTSVIITTRFFDALDYLIENKVIRGKKTFARRYDIDRRNLEKLKQDPSRHIFQPSWLTHLVVDYGISADWLLTGRGSISA